MKKDNRTKRLVLGILLPLIIASFFLFTWAILQDLLIDGKDIKDILALDHELPILLSTLKTAAGYIVGILILTLYAAFASGIQSVFFSILMEYVINPKIQNNVIVLLICGLLGLVSGVLADYIIPGERISLIFAGGATGVMVGKILRDNYNRSPEIEA